MIPKFAVQHQTSFYAPEDNDTWVRRMDDACIVLEQTFPGEKMLTAQPWHTGRGPTVLTDRVKFQRRVARGKTKWVSISNGKFIHGRGDTGTTDPGHLSIGGRTYSSQPGLFNVSTFHPESPWEFNERLLIALGDALGAYTGWLSPQTTFLQLRMLQFGHMPGGPAPPPSVKLPRLKSCAYGGLLAHEQPEILGWLNYWSAATCRFVGFPDPARDQRLLRHSCQTPGGGWLVKVCAEPLDLANPEHVDVLQWAYARFPRLGVRQ